MAVTVVWFRQDLRLADNPALHAAVERGGAIVPAYIWAPDEEGDWAPGEASRVWLHDSLNALDASFRQRKSRLVIRTGPTLDALKAILKSTGADAVYWNRRYEPAAVERDAAIKKALRDEGIEAESFNGSLLHEPWEVATKQDAPYRVFTPYWRACLERPAPREPLDVPKPVSSPDKWPDSLSIDALKLEPAIDWAGGIRNAWTPGENGAHDRLAEFLDEGLTSYKKGRDFPAEAFVSRMSPHLHFGEISPRQIWHITQTHAAGAAAESGASAFLRELGWREFSYHLLYHFPKVPNEPLQEKFAGFPWRKDAKGLKAWQKGRTGFPIVDAGMRELWETGWMHNRVRMIVASFLTKDLLIPWQEGARWFWDTLVDADLANNTQGWQWTSGCGADAAPYFRVFNPTTQGEKFDPDGEYVKRWVPELAQLPPKWIHKPHEAPADVLNEAGIVLGETYPKPIVDHKQARERALEAYEAIKS